MQYIVDVDLHSPATQNECFALSWQCFDNSHLIHCKSYSSKIVHIVTQTYHSVTLYMLCLSHLSYEPGYSLSYVRKKIRQSHTLMNSVSVCAHCM